MKKRSLGKKIFRSKIFQYAVGYLVHNLLRFVYFTNRLDPKCPEQVAVAEAEEPAIYTMWHGQHFLVPYIRDVAKRYNYVPMVSKSDDAQFNAIILNLAGYDVVRGSGGRVREAAIEKGGASATLELKNYLKAGRNVSMIADISKGNARKSGRGIVTLAKLTGRPIIPLAVATSRFKVIESSWDKTTINLPFGRSSYIVGKPIYVPRDSSGEELDTMRLAVDDELNRVTDLAYKTVGHSV